MAAVVQSFPSFHGLNTRSFALAFIVALHAAFFWALTSGLAHRIVVDLPRFTEGVAIPDTDRKPEPEKLVVQEPTGFHFTAPDDASVPRVPIDDFDAPVAVPELSGGGETVAPVGTPVEHAPIIVAPQIDTQRGLREPQYPAQEIRLGNTGTVLLAVEVLGNGKVGGIRLVRSSGHARLDQAAMKAAREWRLVPGTRDGVPTPMWKEVPITFRLQ